MLERIKNMIVKEFIQVLRDRRMKAVVFITPIIQLMVFGYAVTTDVNTITTAVFDSDRTYQSREVSRRLAASGYFDITRHPGSFDEVQDLLDRGRVLAAVNIPAGFSKDLKKGKPAEVQVLVDGTDSNTATVAMDYASRILASYSREVAAERGFSPARAGPASPVSIDLETRAWYNPDLKSRNYNVPGVIAIIVMLISLLLTAMAVVREREIGTMEQLMVTPLRPAELILGKTIPFAILGFVDMILVTVVGVYWFGITIKGSVALLFLSAGVYLLSVLGIGLFISTISRTQQQALMATFLFYLPAVLLSGFMFPIENMPEVIQWGTYLNPLRYFLVIIRGVFLKGTGLAVLWPQLLYMLALGVVVLTLSSLRFRKRLE